MPTCQVKASSDEAVVEEVASSEEKPLVWSEALLWFQPEKNWRFFPHLFGGLVIDEGEIKECKVL